MPAPPLPTIHQTSAGSVAFRRTPSGLAIALIRVGPKQRWQLPKGLVESGESPETTAVRETREEAGIDAELIAPLETITYWYVGTTPDGRVRYHKTVHFFLCEYRSGDVHDHDAEVDEARWVPIDEVVPTLSFNSEQRVAREAIALLERE